jgi:hypothetical protein
VTLVDVAEPSAPVVVRPTRPARVLAACAALFVAYVGLSLLNDPRGYLGTDTGGKVATLQAMERGGTLDPDIGYWAERWDPEGRLHPLYYTFHLGERWVNVTTLPALYAAYPLFKVLGYHGTLVVPMLGSVLAALAARALTRRLRPGDERTGWSAFWLVGLASPLTVYALDFWEHSLGVALLGWAVVLLYDVADGKAGWRAAGAAGLLVGAAATMRTEALVYGAVMTAVACGVLLVRRRDIVGPLLAGVAVVAGLAVPLLGNDALERAAMGSNLRAGRSAGAVLGAGQAEGSRAEEAVLTATSLTPTLTPESYLMGGVLLALLLVFALRASQGTAGERVARVAGAGIAALYLARAADGLGFVPGLVAAAPIAAVGLALGWRRSTTGARLVLGIALAAMPVVWALQYTGGAGPQWGGRYILPSGLLLTVVGVSCLPLLAKWARTAIVGLAVVVTCFGLVWLSARSHDVGRTAEALARRPEPVLVSRVGHLLREAGWYADERRWLTAPGRADVEQAAQVAADSGATSFALVDRFGTDPPVLPGWTAVGTDRLRFISDVYLGITTYESNVSSAIPSS